MLDHRAIVPMLRKVAPRARPEYLAAINAGGALLAAYGILESGDRLAPFLATALAETDGLSITFESMTYTTAERLKEIFGPSHSAKLTDEECRYYLRKPRELAERVYGLGNPKKAAELGNTVAGDGYNCRGGGVFQTTGGDAYRRLGRRAGADFYHHPELIVSAEHALKPALYEWDDNNLNAYADRGDFLSISRIINIGNAATKKLPNGWADRKSYYNRLLPLCRALPEVDQVVEPASAEIVPPRREDPVDEGDPTLRSAQKLLRERGYYEVGEPTGRGGPRTEDAIRAFRKNVGLPDSTEVDADLLAALADERNNRPVSTERAQATAEDLRANGSKTLSFTDRLKKVAGWFFGTAAVGGSVEGGGMVEKLTDGAGKISSVKYALNDWGIGVGTVALFGLAAFVIWWIADSLAEHRVAEYRKGKNP